jgi:hypothetical protein
MFPLLELCALTPFVPFGIANIVTKHFLTSFFLINLEVYCKLLSFRTDKITSLSKPLPIR